MKAKTIITTLLLLISTVCFGQLSSSGKKQIAYQQKMAEECTLSFRGLREQYGSKFWDKFTTCVADKEMEFIYEITNMDLNKDYLYGYAIRFAEDTLSIVSYLEEKEKGTRNAVTFLKKSDTLNLSQSVVSINAFAVEHVLEHSLVGSLNRVAFYRLSKSESYKEVTIGGEEYLKIKVSYLKNTIYVPQKDVWDNGKEGLMIPFMYLNVSQEFDSTGKLVMAREKTRELFYFPFLPSEKIAYLLFTEIKE
jgi:hypothetical protein